MIERLGSEDWRCADCGWGVAEELLSTISCHTAMKIINELISLILCRSI